MTPSVTATRPLFVVPHTHWDREWYRPFESYRYRLVKTLDLVLGSDLPYFLLDGQTVVVDDYLALRPEAETEIKRRIAAGELGAGPWYVLVDEFLVSGESLVRNLLVGRAAMRRLGATGAVGYLPDMFGHIAQMPQILNGFGLTSAVVWRGANPGANRFTWRGPDGSALTTAWLPLGYYQPMFVEALDDAARQAQVSKYLEAFAPAEPVLLLSGADHMAPRPDLASQLEAIAAAGLGVKPHVVPLEKALAGPEPSVVVEGELRDCSKAYLLPGVLSARTYLKQANARCQTLLESYVEPLTALAWAGGRPYPGAFVTHAWQELMKNHPHDSICGCSIDQVHREMMPRFAAVEQVGAELVAEAVQLDDRPRPDPTLMVYNPHGWAFEGWVEATIDWPLASAPESIALSLGDGSAVAAVIRSSRDTDRFCAEIDFNPDWFPVRRFEVAVRVAVPAAGTVAIAVRAGAPETVEAGVRASETALENDRLKVWVERGRVMLQDKATGRTLKDCHFFLDEGDAGDEYNFSPLAGDAPVKSTLVGVKLAEAAPHRATLEVAYELVMPLALSPDRAGRGAETAPLRLQSRLTLTATSPTVEVETRFDHHHRDHRLRVVTSLGAGDRPALWSEGTFGVFERQPVTMPPLPVAKGTEAPMPEFPQNRFTALVQGTGGLAVANEGLPEASLVETEAGWGLATTLLRAVGWLSRDDLRTRGGGAGPRFETPEAQCPGPQAFRYALVPFAGDWTEAMPEAHRFVAPVKAWVAAGLPASGGAVSLGDERVVLSALKRSEDGKHLVVRAYNATPEAIASTLTVHLPHQQVLTGNLAEEPGEALGQGAVPYQLGPYQIRTWLIEL